MIVQLCSLQSPAEKDMVEKKVFQIKIWQVLVSLLGFRHISSLPSPFPQKLQGGQYHLQYLKQQGSPS